MTALATEDRAALMDLEAYEVMPGWDTLAGFVIVKGRINVGLRVGPRNQKAAYQQYGMAATHADLWPVVVLAPAEATRDGSRDDWESVHPIGEDRGVAGPLVALVESLHPDGEWRMGVDQAHSLKVGGQEPVIVRVVNGSVVAMVAPLVRLSERKPIEQEG